MEITKQIVEATNPESETSKQGAMVVVEDSPDQTGDTSNEWAIVVWDESLNQTSGAIVPYAGAVIEDYARIKACHQCRQVKYVFGSCVTKWESDTCPIMLCRQCLKRRYGEIVEAVVANNNWLCPKCRQKCNCSICRGKSGKKATGKLGRAVKESGCDNAAELLEKCEDDSKYVYKRKAATVGRKRKNEVTMLKAAKDKKRKLMKKIKSEIAKGVTENNGIPLSVYQKLAILRKLDAETEAVFMELHNAYEMQEGEELNIAAKRVKKRRQSKKTDGI